MINFSGVTLVRLPFVEGSFYEGSWSRVEPVKFAEILLGGSNLSELPRRVLPGTVFKEPRLGEPYRTLLCTEVLVVPGQTLYTLHQRDHTLRSILELPGGMLTLPCLMLFHICLPLNFRMHAVIEVSTRQLAKLQEGAWWNR